jgi:hypothetical protein
MREQAVALGDVASLTADSAAIVSVMSARSTFGDERGRRGRRAPGSGQTLARLRGRLARG